MRHLTKGSKTINVHLNEEKFYFPGDTISGIVIVHPKSPTKTNQIRLRFSGQVHLALKDKETISLFQETKTIPVSSDGSSKYHILEAKQHTFAFEFTVPKDLPSSMEFEKRKARIRYTLTAIHDRPRVPESLCAKSEYTVPILEYVDVTSPKYQKPQEYNLDFTVPKSKKPQKSHLKATIPRLGYTRGEFVPLSMVLNHHEALVRKTGVKVELVRAVDIRTARNNLSKEDILKSFEHDVNIIGPYNFSQTLTSQLPLPTSTPPTIRYKDQIIDIRYKIRVRLFMNGGRNSTETHNLEIPFIIGTWPRAAVPIDDEDDNELLESMGELMLSDKEDDDLGFDDGSVSYDGDYGPQPTRTSSASVTHRRNLSNPLNNLKSASSSAATLTLRNSQIYSANNGVVRSDSNASRSSLRSHGSVKSYHSNQSWDQSPMLSRNTSIGTSVTTPEQQQFMANHNMALSAIGQNFLNRSTSSPDLLNQLTPDGMHYQSNYRVPDPRMAQQYQANRTSIHENKMMDYHQQHATPRPYYGIEQQHQQQHYPQQLAASPSYPAYTPAGYGSVPRYPSEYQQPPTTSTNNVPTHVLQPLDNASYQPRRSENASPTLSSPSMQKVPNPFHSNHNMTGPSAQVSSDSDDSDDDGDLFRIIEKKKKERQKQEWMQQQQQQQHQ